MLRPRSGAPERLTKSGGRYFIADRLRFAFNRETLAIRYRLKEGDSLTKAALHHVIFLMRSYWARGAQWFRRQT